MLYRKKTPYIEAVKFDGTTESVDRCKQLCYPLTFELGPNPNLVYGFVYGYGIDGTIDHRRKVVSIPSGYYLTKAVEDYRFVFATIRNDDMVENYEMVPLWAQ